MVILPDQHANVAILLFAFSSDAESKRKRITKSQRVNKLLWKGLQAKTTRLLKEIGYDYVIFDENDQNGDNFGEKIAHAVQSVFDFGYEKVIVIGKDCPELSQRHISEAFHNLQTKKSGSRNG
ncbi:MAG: DUF2064 domain-containing protein [Saprospiraceae bacterium]|nr:DUF2064 domain-containing protein [Saprospiraceae bacterium]